MTSKERMLVAMRNKQPDMVPVTPDISNMIPCKLTGKPFWDIYLYNDPPLWKAYIDAVKYFGFDGWFPNVIIDYDEGSVIEYKKETVIVFKNEERIITREYTDKGNNKKDWSEFVTVYYVNDPPSYVKASKIGMDKVPDKFWHVESIKEQNKYINVLQEVKNYMGDKGVVGVGIWPPSLSNPEGNGYSIYDYYDKNKEVKDWAIKLEENALKRLKKILSASIKPDFILTGGSGLLIFNTPEILRDLTLPTLQKITKMCRDAGVPTQIHCCGPERALIEMCANETDLDSINPIEIPPMGDCELKEIKKSFGSRLSLMGNLHTTEVMLKGTPEIVEKECRKAIDDVAEGGGFILSTGDQCGRDTPEENIFKMIEIARTYGRY